MLSVALCTYNGEKYIVEQLDSIAMQSVTVDEVVICDDVSTDNTVKLVQDYTFTAPYNIYSELFSGCLLCQSMDKQYRNTVCTYTS